MRNRSTVRLQLQAATSSHLPRTPHGRSSNSSSAVSRLLSRLLRNKSRPMVPPNNLLLTPLARSPACSRNTHQQCSLQERRSLTQLLKPRLPRLLSLFSRPPRTPRLTRLDQRPHPRSLRLLTFVSAMPTRLPNRMIWIPSPMPLRSLSLSRSPRPLTRDFVVKA